jgi:hypothetical protein
MGMMVAQGGNGVNAGHFPGFGLIRPVSGAPGQEFGPGILSSGQGGPGLFQRRTRRRFGGGRPPFRSIIPYRGFPAAAEEHKRASQKGQQRAGHGGSHTGKKLRRFSLCKHFRHVLLYSASQFKASHNPGQSNEI